jgi:hypothetical protein
MKKNASITPEDGNLFEKMDLQNYKRMVKSSPPHLSFFAKGRIVLNASFVDLIQFKKIDHTPLYIHLYKSGDKLRLSVNDNHKGGLFLRSVKKQNKIIELTTFCRGLVEHLAQTLDWPIGDGKLSRIRYKIEKIHIDQDTNEWPIFNLH